MIIEHKIQMKYVGVIECSCGWYFDIVHNTPKSLKNLQDCMREAICGHVNDFMKTGEYVRLAPGSTMEIFKLKSLCTEEDIDHEMKLDYDPCG